MKIKVLTFAMINRNNDVVNRNRKQKQINTSIKDMKAYYFCH